MGIMLWNNMFFPPKLIIVVSSQRVCFFRMSVVLFLTQKSVVQMIFHYQVFDVGTIEKNALKDFFLNFHSCLPTPRLGIKPADQMIILRYFCVPMPHSKFLPPLLSLFLKCHKTRTTYCKGKCHQILGQAFR